MDGMELDGLGDLSAHGHEGVHRRLRVLEDHGDLLAPDLAHDVLGRSAASRPRPSHGHDLAVPHRELHEIVQILQQVLLDPVGLEPDLAGDDARPRADEPHDRQRRDALAAAALADHAERLALGDLEAHAVHGADEGLLAASSRSRSGGPRS